MIAEEDTPGGPQDEWESGNETPHPGLEKAVEQAEVLKQQLNYELSAPIMLPMDETKRAKFDGVEIMALGDMASAVNDTIGGTNFEVDSSDAAQEFFTDLMQGFRAHPSKGIFEDVLSNPNADWRNSIKYDGRSINQGRPNYKNQGRNNGNMSSDRLVMSIRSRMGIGAPVQTPLMASGFYVTHRPLEESDIINLWREVLTETIRLGRVTHGLIFSNNQVFVAGAILKAFVATMIDTTVSNMNKEDILDHISINDIPTIAQSLASAIYPNGFPMSRPVFTEKSNLPKEQVSQMIDIRKALVMDRTLFTDEQLMHMVSRVAKPMSLKQVKEYCAAFKFNHPTVVDLGNEVKLHLRTPSVREYLDSGEKWISEITNTVSEALGSEPTDRDRASYISKLAQSSRLRQYAHYVGAIEEDGELYTTRENVDRVLTSLSADSETSERYYKTISDYINATQVAVVATTSLTEYEDETSGKKWPRLIPIDAISTFFQLVEQKLRGITQRRLEAS